MSKATSQSILWSLRWTFAFGWHWQNERNVTPQTQEAWLVQFRKDEPGVEFVVAPRAPKAPRGAHAPCAPKVRL